MPLSVLSKHQSACIGGRHGETISVVRVGHFLGTESARTIPFACCTQMLGPARHPCCAEGVCMLQVRPAHMHTATCDLAPSVPMHTPHTHAAACGKHAGHGTLSSVHMPRVSAGHNTLCWKCRLQDFIPLPRVEGQIAQNTRKKELCNLNLRFGNWKSILRQLESTKEIDKNFEFRKKLWELE